VIGATTTTSAIGGKKGLELLKGYDWLIIDEVSKCPITEVLRYLPYVKHIIMVGDDFQLAPLLEFTKEDVEKLSAYDEDKFERLKRIYEESVFAKTLQKAKEAGRLVTLTVNYRSLENVLRAYNVFYGGELENKREKVRPKKVLFDDNCPLSNKYDSFFIDVQYGKEARDNTSRYNVQELEATALILRDLIGHTLNKETISVAAIFPYAAQISRFQKGYKDLINEAKRVFKSFEIDTVDAFQGKEADIVLVNTVVTDPSQRNFLNDFRRINVSVSRARDKLFVFGNPTTLSQIDMQVAGGDKRRYFAEIINDIRKFGGMIKYEGGESYELASKPKISII
jgi:superfamily I DNA and/or RNA helicase